MSGMNQKNLTSGSKEHRAGLFGLIKNFWPFIWKRRGTLAGAYCLNVAAVGAIVLSPWPLKIIIDNVLGGAPYPASLDKFLYGFSPETMVILLAAASAVIAVVGTLSSASARILNAKVREHMGLNLRDRLLCHLQTFPPTLRNTYRSGELVLRLINDVNQVARLFNVTLPEIFRLGTDILTTFAVMFWIEPRLAGFSGLIVLLLGWLVKGHTGPLQKASRQKRRREGQTAGLAQEIIRGIPTIQALGIENAIQKRFKKSNSKSLNAGLHELRVAIGMERILRVASGIMVGLVIGGGGLLVLWNQITVGELTVFAAYVIRLLKPVEKMNEMASSVSRAVARGELLISLLDQKSIVPEVSDHPDQIRLDKPSAGLLELRGVTFAYPGADSRSAGEPVLENLDLRLERGQLAVLTGPSGSGKSTLLYLLLRLLDPSSGQILLDNIPYDRLNLRSLRSQFAVMLQDTHLFAGSIRETLRPANKKLEDEALWGALKLVAMDDHVRKLPDRLDTELDEDGVNFSGGQRARLSLARAFLLNRPFLILDEPLANVDVDSQKIILDALNQIRPGRTCLVITHQLSLLDRADVILQLKDRRILEFNDLTASE
ncbi:MAG: ABC transporter ATP-binding protein [Nitrospinaceae bacterium]